MQLGNLPRVSTGAADDRIDSFFKVVEGLVHNSCNKKDMQAPITVQFGDFLSGNYVWKCWLTFGMFDESVTKNSFLVSLIVKYTTTLFHSFSC